MIRGRGRRVEVISDGTSDRWCGSRLRMFPNKRGSVRISLLSLLMISVGFSEALAQTAASPSAAPAPAAPSAAPAAPATGAPALSPTPTAPSPTGVVVPPTPSVNSTPSQSNVDLHPPSRLTNPGGPAGPQPKARLPRRHPRRVRRRRGLADRSREAQIRRRQRRSRRRLAPITAWPIA